MLKRNLRGELTVIHSEHLDEMDLSALLFVISSNRGFFLAFVMSACKMFFILVSRLSKFLGITSSAETRLLRNALFPPLVCNAAHGNDVQLLEVCLVFACRMFHL